MLRYRSHKEAQCEQRVARRNNHPLIPGYRPFQAKNKLSGVLPVRLMYHMFPLYGRRPSSPRISP